MFNLFGGPGGILGMLKNFVPVLVVRIQIKIGEEEQKYGGPVLFMLTNDYTTPGSPKTSVTTFGYKNARQPEDLGTVDLAEAIASPETLAQAMGEVERQLDALPGIGDFVKPYLSQINGETVGTYLGHVTDYLHNLGEKHGGRAVMNLQVVKNKSVVQVICQGEGRDIKPVELTSLEKFIVGMIDQFTPAEDVV